LAGKNRGEVMNNYSVRFRCDKCSQDHAMGRDISLENGPTSNTTIGDFFADREIDPQLRKIISNKVLCPGTGNLTSQQDMQKIFLTLLEG
jgi:hypothetical protein